MTIEEFEKIIPEICSKETSIDPDTWSDTNPTWGHCAIVSLLAQEYFGGALLKISLKNIPEFKEVRSHFFNKLREDIEADFTFAQFRGKLPKNILVEEKSKEEVLASPGTSERYQILRAKFKASCLK